MHIPVPAAKPSDYERSAIEEIVRWRNPTSTLFSEASETFGRVVDDATSLIRKVPGADWTLDTLVAGLLEILNEISLDTVWTEGVYADFTKDDFNVSGPGDAHLLDLESVDRLTGALRTKYVAVGGAEGATTGYAGAAGILPDILALTAMNLRAAGEYATYYGFDVAHDTERLFALNLLNAAAGGTDLNKDFALRPVSRASSAVAKQQMMESAGQMAITKSIKKALEKLGLKLTKAKLAQLLPVAGAVVGSSFNIYFTNRVCKTCYNIYRERFLIAKYGPEVVRG